MTKLNTQTDRQRHTHKPIRNKETGSR